MKYFFLDTNVIIDFLANRMPYAAAAQKLFTLASEGKATLYVAAISYNNIYYLFRRSQPHEKIISVLKELLKQTKIVDVDTTAIRDSLDGNFNDFEVAIQNYCASTIKNLAGLVTRNSKDFKKSHLPILNPEEAVGLFS